jgi:hypothetical protein
MEAESSARDPAGARRVAHHERRQEVHRRLVVADRRQYAGHGDLDRSFLAVIVVRRLLDVPFTPGRILDDHAGIGAGGFQPQEAVDRVGIGRTRRTPGTVEQILIAQIVRLFPQRGQRRIWRHRLRLNRRRAQRHVRREDHRDDPETEGLAAHDHLRLTARTV